MLWTKLANISSFEVRINNEIFSKSGTEDSSHKIISFQEGSWELLLALDESSLTIDSDLKESLMGHVSKALMRRLEKIRVSSNISLS